jgi:hypothetical protein
MNEEEFKARLTDMGYCVEEIHPYVFTGDKPSNGEPDCILLVKVSDEEKYISFNVFGDVIRKREITESDLTNDDLPF